MFSKSKISIAAGVFAIMTMGFATPSLALFVGVDPPSLQSAGDVTGSTLSSMGLPLFGAHHRPLMSYAGLDKGKCAWGTIDGGYNGGGEKGYLVNEEAGICGDFADNSLRLGFGLGQNNLYQETIYSGKQNGHGGYGVAEADYRLQQAIVSLTGFYGITNADIDRGYLIIGIPNISKGSTNVDTAAAKLMVNWLDVANFGGFSLSPRLSYTFAYTHADGYRESGGTAPAVFGGQSMTGHYFRLGLEGKKTFNGGKTDFIGTLEAVHYADNDGNISGSVSGTPFSISHGSVHHNWARVGVDLDHRLNDGMVLSGSLFGSTAGMDPDATGAVSLKVSF
ncbi:MAG: autotransporter domain-containing protein [Alphaproteobacteria bacterium]|nr:autotransporter domain-containing protein [Alphaproteobacteria bacterium]